jgi:hypothetical protein
MLILISSNDFQVTNVFSDVGTFDIAIEIDLPLASGNYVNPNIVAVSYSVSGTLTPGTPSGFPSFALQRDMTGAEFYAQGSSISFEIAAGAVLTDGVQVDELVGNGIVFTMNAREVGNGRFHPALLEIDMNGTGRIQNSDNVIVEVPLQQVNFGDEYITDLMFDPGNTTLIVETPALPPPPTPVPFSGGNGAISWVDIGVLATLALMAFAIRMRKQLGVKSH